MSYTRDCKQILSHATTGREQQSDHTASMNEYEHKCSGETLATVVGNTK